ncbi:MAG: hypothetical protein J3R72DRAFT_353205, partial [Linnemannia gamsii]
LKYSVSTGSVPSPIPANECSVHPRMLQAAIPVDAVTATCPAAWESQSSSLFLHRLCLDRNRKMSSRNKTDFPVPADPVKNT